MHTSTSQRLQDDEKRAIDEALRQLAEPEAPELSLEALSDLSRPACAYLRSRWSDLPPAVRVRVVSAMRTDAEAHIEHNFNRALRIALDDADAATRLAAAEGLAEDESTDFLDVLLDRIEREESDAVRAVEAQALGRFALLAELEALDLSLAARVRNTLLRLIEDDPSTEVRRRALESAGYLSDDEVAAEIERAYDSGEYVLQVSAIHAMGRQADARWMEFVHQEMTSNEPELRYEAAVAAGAIGDQQSVAAVVDLLADDDAEVRLAAIAALGAIGGTLAINTLRRLVRDESEATADAAEEALEEALLASDPLRPLM
jgi:HEAT repeat protein